MSQNDDHIGQEDEDPSRTLDAVKPLYELGSRIGCYKLVSVIGEGGFGTVYLAQQEHRIKRLVALKVIKPGMDTRQVIARFETERQRTASVQAAGSGLHSLGPALREPTGEGKKRIW